MASPSLFLGRDRISPMLALLLTTACSPPSAPANAPDAEEAPAAPEVPALPEAPASPESATHPSSAGADEVTVDARIVGRGPIGSGRCTQQSYEIEIVAPVEGRLPPETRWVHFESCTDAPAPEPGPGAVDPSALDDGTTYRLRLRRGASESFGDEPMIIEATPR